MAYADNKPDYRQEFLSALDAYVLSMIEQHAKHGSTVPYATIDRWKNSRVVLSLTLANLLEHR